MTETAVKTEDWSFDWRVTKVGGDVKLDIGDALTALMNDAGNAAIVHVIGEGLIAVGIHLMGSRVGDDDEWDEE